MASTLQKLAEVICPDCPPVREAHAMFVASLWPYLAYAVLPFVLVALAVLIALRVLGARDERP